MFSSIILSMVLGANPACACTPAVQACTPAATNESREGRKHLIAKAAKVVKVAKYRHIMLHNNLPI